MPTLEVISINIWQIIISLANLLILTLILKKLLYAPVRKALADRRAAIDADYAAADRAKNEALESKRGYESKLSTAKAEADKLRENALSEAELRSERLIGEAKAKADEIVNRAKEEAELERIRAEQDVKREIADVSAALTEKLLGRELNEEAHRELIDDFIDKLGESK